MALNPIPPLLQRVAKSTIGRRGNADWAVGVIFEFCFGQLKNSLKFLYTPALPSPPSHLICIQDDELSN
jgi:hypothetical protein